MYFSGQKAQFCIPYFHSNTAQAQLEVQQPSASNRGPYNPGLCNCYLIYIQLLVYNDLFSLVNQGCSLQLWVVSVYRIKYQNASLLSLYYSYYILYDKADLCDPNIYNNYSVVKSKSQTLLSNDRCNPFQNSKHVFI